MTAMEPSEKKKVARGNWSNKVEFLLSLIGFTVGFGNVWRFPYLCHRYGGGAFLIPYLTMIVLAGIPIYFLEVLIGQYSALGPLSVWKMTPLFKGLGISILFLTGTANVYYTTLLAYVLFYLFASMTTELPWAHCGNPWNTPACQGRFNTQSDANNTTGVYGVTTMPTNESSVGNETLLKLKSPAEEYFERYVIDLSSGIDEIGHIKWKLCLCLLLAWTLVFLILIKGIKSIGKVVYFTATFPYVILLVLLVRGLTLDGSVNGLYYYIVPKWEELLGPRIWGDAAAQIFFSLGPSWGCLITFASYNKFHHNCLRDTLITTIVCAMTSILAGTVVFSVMGFVAKDMNVPVSKVMTSGPGLAFVAYPEALAQLPGGPFWSVAFFLMLLTCGIDTMFSMVEMMIVSLSDRFPLIMRNKTLFTLGVCIVYFLIGLPQVTRGGMYIFNLFDWYIALVSPIIIGFMELFVVVFVYGYKKVAQDVYYMLGRRPGIYFTVTWCFFAPVIMLAIITFSIIKHTPVVYNDYTYPEWAIAFGWIIAMVPLIPIPAHMVYAFATFKGKKKETGFLETLKALCRPAEDWGPASNSAKEQEDLHSEGLNEPLTHV